MLAAVSLLVTAAFKVGPALAVKGLEAKDFIGGMRPAPGIPLPNIFRHSLGPGQTWTPAQESSKVVSTLLALGNLFVLLRPRFMHLAWTPRSPELERAVAQVKPVCSGCPPGWQTHLSWDFQFQAESREGTPDKLRVRKDEGLSKQEDLLVARDTLGESDHLRSHQAARLAFGHVPAGEKATAGRRAHQPSSSQKVCDHQPGAAVCGDMQT